MASNNPKLTIRVTPAQLKAIQDAVTNAGISQAEWLRQAVAEKCKRWVDDYPTHGGKRDIEPPKK